MGATVALRCECGKTVESVRGTLHHTGDPFHQMHDHRPVVARSTEEQRFTVGLTRGQALAASYSLLNAICGTSPSNAGTWHGGLGPDLCDHCCALVIVREAAQFDVVDWLRP